MESREPLLLRTTALFVLCAGLVYGAWFYQESQDAARQTEQPAVPALLEQNQEMLSERYTEVHLRSTTQIVENYEIIGDPAADQRIYDIASQRGYELGVEADEALLVEVDNVRLQPEAAAAWKEVREAAKEEDIGLELVEGYVSLERQQGIFLDALTTRSQEVVGRPYTPAQIAGGIGDALINAILREYPLPGHSVHHSGFAVSIDSEDSDWLEENGRTVLADYGFVPLNESRIGTGGLDVFQQIFIWVDTKDEL